MLDPSAFNNPLVRLLAVGIATLVFSFGSKQAGTSAIATAHVLSFGIWAGFSVWVTFIQGFIMFKHMPRQLFGKVQNKLFPWYFSVNTAAIGIIGVTLLISGVEFQKTLLAVIGGGAIANIANILYIQPKVSNVMHKRYGMEDNPADFRGGDSMESVKKEFGLWHAISSASNLVNIASVFGYAAILARRSVFFKV